MQLDFIREIVAADVAAKKHPQIATRFPPEPNGYLHIGHAKSICLNFGIAAEYGGRCHLRMDDTNPTTESVEYVESIKNDVRWLGFDWGDNLFYASDYFEQLYGYAAKLISDGKAYVCSLSDEEFSEKYRGTISEPGKHSPYRTRSKDENLTLLGKMRAGELAEGSAVVRLAIDMASPNMKMRDPAIFRIKKAHHYRTGDTWCIYPLYDFAHSLSDAIEGITHSICTLEFQDNRELYDWIIAHAKPPAVPHQYEFARLNLTYTVMSKRRLLELVNEKRVSGWDDPRMPTISGMRRRGYTADAIRAFCGKIGIAKNNSTVDLQLLEHTLREDLNARSPRIMGVLKPLRLVVENFGEDEVDDLDAPYWPHDIPKEGSRTVPFSRVLWIEQSDFMENPPKDYFRLAPGAAVRLRYGYVIECTGFTKDESGNVTEVRCTVDRATRGGGGRKVKGTIHWVSAAHALDCEVRVYDRLFAVEDPGKERDWRDDMNPRSLEVLSAKLEPSVKNANAGEHYQLERTGFFFVDPIDWKPSAPVFNRTVTLPDTWAKMTKAQPVSTPAKEKPKAKEPEVVIALTPEAEALRTAHALLPDQARLITDDAALVRLFEQGLAAGAEAKALASVIVNDVAPHVREKRVTPLPFDGAALAELVSLVRDGTITATLSKDVLTEMVKTGAKPRAIVAARGLEQIASEADLSPIVGDVLSKNADAVARYKGGNANVLGALVGMVMKATRGKANAKVVTEILKKQLA